MNKSLFASEGTRTTYKKFAAGLLMLSLNFSLGGVGAMLLGTQVAYANANDNDNHTRIFSAAISPTSVATSASQTYTVTITNSSSSGDPIKSGIITIPSSWSSPVSSPITLGGAAATGYTATFNSSASRIEINRTSSGIAIAPGQAFTVAFTTTAPASSGTSVFTTRMFKNDSGWNGGGDEFTQSTSNPQVVVSAPISAGITAPGTTGPSGSISYTVSGATTITCTLDGHAVSCTLAGPYSFTGLSGGSHTFALHATSGANFADATATWTVDATGPTVTINTHPSDPSQTSSATFTFSSNETPSTFKCKLDTGTPVSCSSGVNYSSLSDGSHTFSVTGTDQYGNQGSAATYTWTVDTTAPTIAVHADVTAEATSASGAVVTYTAPATTDTIDGSGVATCSPASGSLFAFGDTTVTCNATDAAGNHAPATTFVVHVVDTTPPAITLQPVASPTKTPSAEFTLFDLFSIVSVQCGVDGANFAVCTSPFGPSSLSDGLHTITVQATDEHGNTGHATTDSFTVDHTAPSVTIETHPDALTKSTDAPFTFTGEAGATFTCALDAATFTACTSPVDYTTVGEGEHTFTVHATDAAGNVGADSFTWTVDTTAPTVSITSPAAGDTTGASGSITYTVSDGTVVCTLDGVTVPCTATGPYSFGPLSDGNHTFTVTATDGAGNTNSQSVTWRVDATAPVITLLGTNPASVTVGNSYADAGATALDNIDGDITAKIVTVNPVNTAVVGAYTVTYNVTDTAGNAATEVTRTVNVSAANVEVPPTDVCPNIGGTQTSVPEGMQLVDGQCVIVTTPPSDNGGGNGGGGGGGGSGGGSGTYDYYGCTNPSATNYNSLANKDDGSCKLPGGNGTGGTVTPPPGTPAATPAPAGEVLGAATTTGELPLPTSCTAYLSGYLKKGKKNDSAQVKLLQTFLNEEMGTSIPVTGYFGDLTYNWVKKFQVKHKKDILQPWIDAGFGGLDFGNSGTGYVYKTTKRAINLVKCAELQEPMPTLVPETAN